MQPQTPQRAWGRPEPVKTFGWADYAGETAIWIHGGVHETIKTSFGEKPAARGTVIVLTGRSQNEVFDDVMIFNAALLSQVRNMAPGTDTLARIVARGKSVTFEAASAYDEQVANYWVATNPGRLESLAREAVHNFAEQARALVAPAGSTSYGPPPAPVTYAPPAQTYPPTSTSAAVPQPSYVPPPAGAVGPYGAAYPQPASAPPYEPVRPDAGAYPPPAPNGPQGPSQGGPPHLPNAAYGGGTGVPPANPEEAGY